MEDKERTPFDELDWEEKKTIYGLRTLSNLLEDKEDLSREGDCDGLSAIIKAMADQVEKHLITLSERASKEGEPGEQSTE